MGLRDHVVVVTGASSGVGRATAEAFARKGCAVVLAARREEALEAAAKECEKHRGARTLVVPTDTTDAGAVETLARRAVAQFGRIDVWINDADPSAALSLVGPGRVQQHHVFGPSVCLSLDRRPRPGLRTGTRLLTQPSPHPRHFGQPVAAPSGGDSRGTRRRGSQGVPSGYEAPLSP
ncbi:SDR family NAD(P)-dependent oxidoreductase [Streptomyces canus]|uniref:SDR family NAD(P)-dependent oxidoreductase n=1 Tax=Streptomyces canus TaxID=58343 RepID=UPI00340EEFCF